MIVFDEVNLRVLFSKLLRICFILNILLISFFGNGVILRINFNFLLCVDFVMRVIIFFNSLLGENGWLLICSLLVLILEKFKMLFIIVSRLFVVVLMICICFCCLVGKVVLVNLWLNFKIVFSGVLILWFILVRNCDLILLVFMVFLWVIFSLVFCFFISFILLCKLLVVCVILSFNWFWFFFISVNENKLDLKNMLV